MGVQTDEAEDDVIGYVIFAFDPSGQVQFMSETHKYLPVLLDELEKPSDLGIKDDWRLYAVELRFTSEDGKTVQAEITDLVMSITWFDGTWSEAVEELDRPAETIKQRVQSWPPWRG